MDPEQINAEKIDIELKVGEEDPGSAELISISDHFETLSLLGEGGMGRVFEVRNRDLDSHFAVKVLDDALAKDRTALARFIQEAKSISKLNHPNIIGVYEHGTTNSGAPYLVMDCLDGKTLGQSVKDGGPFEPSRAINIFLQIAEALDHAHKTGIIHRDVKPSNVMLCRTESGLEAVKVLDFGIAKVLPMADTTATLTQTGDVFGSPLYMSPEQCEGHDLDQRSDIYSFGCLMFEVLTGKAPFAGENPFKVMLSQVQKDPPAMRQVNSDIDLPRGMESMIRRCLAKNPADRYQSMEELMKDLRLLEQGQVPKATTALRSRHSFRAATALGTGLLMVTSMFLIGLLTYLARHDPPRTTIVAPQSKPERVELYQGKNLSQWSAAIEKSPQDKELFYSRGQLHQLRDERNDAIADYTRALEIDPGYARARRTRALLYSLVADYAKAQADADRLIKDDPDWPDGYEVRGFVESAAEELEKAEADVRKSIALAEGDPGNRSFIAGQHYHLADILNSLGRFEEARMEADRAIEMADGDYPTALALGIRSLTWAGEQNFDRALADAKRAVAMKDARAAEWAILAHAYAGKKDFQKTAEALGAVERLETFPARGYRLRGEVRRAAGQLEKALEDFSASTSLEEYGPGYRQKGMVYMQLGQLKNALDALEKSFTINPRSPITEAYLASLEQKFGKTDLAERHINEALARSQHPVVLARAAETRLQQGRAPDALKLIELSIKADPYAPESYVIRARIYNKLGFETQFAEDLAKAEKLTSHLDF
ncbi:MAG: protein kinase [Candidatus Obscuribacterales bacterium]